MNRPRFKWVIILLLIITVVIALLIYATNPDAVGPGGVTAFFILVYSWWFFLIELIVRLFARAEKWHSLTDTSHFVFVAILAGIPTVVLALQSLDQLALRDIVIIVFLAFSVIFYWSKRE